LAFTAEKLKGRYHLGSVGTDVRIILKRILHKRCVCKGMNWTRLTRDRVQGWALVNTVKCYGFYKHGEGGIIY
jgi:hypothetical protein